MKKALAIFGVTALCGAALPSTTLAASSGDRTDFAFFDTTNPDNGDTGVACGVRRGSTLKPMAFTYYISISNWSDSTQVLRVVYGDGDFLRFQILPHDSIQITQAAGSTKGIDDTIRVFAEGLTAGPDAIAGSISIITGPAARPHPLVSSETFCVTLSTPMP